MNKTIILLITILSLVMVACTNVDLPPEPPNPGEQSEGALVGHSINFGEEDLQYFAIGQEHFTLSKESMLQGTYYIAEIKNEDLIYRKGYRFSEKTNGWEEFNYEGVEEIGNWIKDSAEHGENAMDIGENYILAYACTRMNENWDCHDNKWIIKKIEVLCEDDIYCDEGLICKEGKCVSGCKSNEECEGNTYCDNGKCVQLPNEPEKPASTEKVSLCSGK